MNELAIRNLRKTYDGRNYVLTDVNVEAAKGEFIVLVGPSGCGKSTLLRMIAGLEEISSGEIEIAGRVVNDVAPSDRDIAMVFQDYALYPHMSVRDNLTFALRIKKVDAAEIDRRLRTASEMLGIGALLDRKPSQLSGGQRQRVAIGRSIVRQPSIFLFDEPLSNLDAQLRAQTRIELASLHRGLGSTSVYVTHDQVEAMTLADKIVVLNRGYVQQVGTPLDLYHRPANKFVASFIGNPSMNFVDGQLERASGGKASFRFGPITLDLSGGRLPSDAAGALTLGIRPEALQLKTGSGQGDFTGRVILVEAHGFESQLVVDVEGSQWISRTSDCDTLDAFRTLRSGDTVPLAIDRENLHWFEPKEEGIRIE